MRRIILTAVAATLGFSTAAKAQCVDTLFLTDLTVLHTTVVNSKALGTWDTTTLDPWNDLALKKANGVNLGDHEFVYTPHSRTISHPRTVYYQCGADSHSVIEYVTVTDSFYKDTRGNPVISTGLATSSTPIFLTLSTNSGFVFNGISKSFAILYSDQQNPTFSVGRRLSTDSLQSWSSDPMAFYFDSVPVPHVLSVGGYYPGALEDYAKGTPDSALAALGPYVDKIKTGQVDSTRLETKIFRYTYSYSKPTSAIRSRDAVNRAFLALSSSRGVEIQLDRAAQIVIVGLDGKVATEFAAHAGSNLWNGRSSSGNRLTGLWIVRAEGIGARSVILR